MEQEGLRYLTSVLGGLYVLTVTLWAICLPTIREARFGGKEFSLIYWVISLAFPATMIIGSQIAGADTSDSGTVWEATLGALLIVVFVVFAWGIFRILSGLSRTDGS